MAILLTIKYKLFSTAKIEAFFQTTRKKRVLLFVVVK
jgi:hypothetical protein